MQLARKGSGQISKQCEERLVNAAPATAFDACHRTFACLFLLSQAYTIPIVCVGPWALWPTIADCVIWLWAVLLLIEPRTRGSRLSDSAYALLRLIAILVGLASLSFLCVTWFASALHGETYGTGKGLLFGAFMLMRLVQAYFVSWGAARARLVATGGDSARGLAAFALVTVALAPVLTRCGLTTADVFAPHIPRAIEQAGPWAFYHSHSGLGWGLTGYNHAYTAVQISLLTAVCLSGTLQPTTVKLSAILGISTLGVIASGSRMGLLMHAAYLTPFLGRRPFLGFLLAAGSIAALYLSPDVGLNDGFVDVMQRQASILGQLDSENLSGRDDIWAHYVAELLRNPYNLIAGLGFGNSFSLGGGAHMMALTVLTEGGLIGMVSLTWAVAHLYRLIPPGKIISHRPRWLLATLILSSATQETLYPVPAFGNTIAFLGFILAGDIATLGGIAVRRTSRQMPQYGRVLNYAA